MNFIFTRFNICIFYASVLLLLLPIPSWSDDDIEVHYAYWRSDQPVLLADVRHLNESKWHKVNQLASYGFDDGEYWVRLTIHNTASRSVKRVFRFLYPILDEVDVYHFVATKLKDEWHMGDAVAGLNRVVHEKNAAFRVSLSPDQHSEIYIRV